MTDTRVSPEQSTRQSSERSAERFGAQFREHRTRWAIAGVATVLVAGAGVLGAGLVGSTATITDSVAGVREVVVAIGAGPVNLTGTSGTEVVIETISHGLFPADAGHALEDGVLTISARGWGLNSYTEENVAIPAGIPVHVHTGAGDVTAVDLDVPRFSMDAGASSVDLSFATAPDAISVDAGAAGNIEIRVPDGGFAVTADARIGSEDVLVDDVPGAARGLHAETFAGNITIAPR